MNSHTPVWITELSEYIKDRVLPIEHEFSGANREQRRNRNVARGRRLPLKAIGKSGFTQPGGGRRFH